MYVYEFMEYVQEAMNRVADAAAVSREFGDTAISVEVATLSELADGIELEYEGVWDRMLGD